jgi:hypothetical protein
MSDNYHVDIKQSTGVSTMTKATMRANARTLPEATKPTPAAPASPAATPPDEYIRALAAKCVADARYEAAAEKRKAEADAKAEEPKLKASEAFVTAHFDWLCAVASIKDPEASDEEMEERFAAETEAERHLFITAAAYPEQVWQKLEGFEGVLHDELVSGQRNNSVLLLALGSIKQDMDLLEAAR